MKYDKAFFDAGLEREGTWCAKWDSPEVMEKGGIALWIADMDFACAGPIVDALRERALHPCYGYNADNPENAKALCDFWARRHAVSIRPDQTLMLPCVVTGLRAAVRAFTGPEDTVAIFTPCYGPFYASVLSNGRKLAGVPLLRDEKTLRYSMNLPGMEEALRAGAKLVMLCNPHNPVSRLWSREELTALVKLAKKYGVPLVSDEIHADFVYQPGKFVSILSVPEAQDCAMMLCAASKTFNVAGLQQAQAVSCVPEMIEKMEKECEAAGVESGNTFALAGTRAAYEKCDDWLDGLMDYLDDNRQKLPELIREYLPKARLTPIEATYLSWIDLRAYGETSEELTNLFKKHKVAVNAGTAFGAEGEGFVRVNFGCPLRLLEEGIKRMSEALREA